MPSFSDSIVLFVLALLLFGPKKLPMLAREIGKWVGEFRRASNEFKMQMEEELRSSEQVEREKTIAAMEAAAPVAPALEAPATQLPEASVTSHNRREGDVPPVEVAAEAAAPVEPLPIANSGDLNLMPPATGLPTPRGKSGPLGGLLQAIPPVEETASREAEVQHD